MVAVIFAVYNIAAFGIAGFNDYNATFWISYVFVLIAFAVITVAIALLEHKYMKMRDWLFRLPLIKQSVIFATLELIVSILFMSLSEKIEAGIALAVQIVVLGVYAIFAISCIIAKDMILEVGNHIKDRTTYIKLLKLDAETVARITSDTQVKKAFTELAEKIRFSDNMGCDEVADIETELSECIKEALSSAKNNDTEQCLKCYERAVLLLEERNDKCKIFKQ